jgi:hypothetical protein
MAKLLGDGSTLFPHILDWLRRGFQSAVDLQLNEPFQEFIMSLQAHIDVLKERHANLDIRISDEGGRPQPDSTQLYKMKVEKLRLKEEMEGLSRKH